MRDTVGGEKVEEVEERRKKIPPSLNKPHLQPHLNTTNPTKLTTNHTSYTTNSTLHIFTNPTHRQPHPNTTNPTGK